MYLRTTRQPRQHGPDVIYYQLAEHDSHEVRRRSETRLSYHVGRADQVDPEALRRLAQSLRRVANDARIDLAARQFPPEVGIDDLEPVTRSGVRSVAHALWEAVGIGPLLREKMQPDGGDAPHETALFTMTANRLARPAATLAGDERWLADDVYWPAAQGLALEHLDRGLDVLRRHLEALAQERCVRTAELFNADVDLICWETTTLSCELDAEDDDGAGWEDEESPALRKRGPHQEGRDGNPQVVVGLALTRDGLPVRSWVCPGHTADVTTSDDLKADLRGWRLNRGVCVGDRGRFSEAKRQRLSRALGRYILAVPRRQVTEVPQEVLSRPGRSRDVAHTLRGKEVWVGEGARRRRSVVGHNPDEAAREHAHRARLLALLRAELAALAVRQADHPKRACARMASRRFGRYLSMDTHGRLSLDTAKVAMAAKDDGKVGVTTNADTLDAEAVALGYTSMTRIEGGFRRMQTTGRQTRPISPGRPQRIIAPVKLGVLALRLERAAELRCQQTWRTIRQTLDHLQVVRYRMHGKTMLHSTQMTATITATLRSLGIPLPKRILDVSESAHAPYLP